MPLREPVRAGAAGAEPRELCVALRGAQRELAKASPRQIGARLAQLAELWLGDDSPWFARAVTAIAAEAGFSAAMVQRALPALIEPLRGDCLRSMAERLERNPPTAPTAPTALTVQILPSNVPALAAVATALALLCRSATLLKPGRRDRAFTGLWVESLAAFDPDLGACVAAASWSRGDAREADALAAADLVIASGGDTAIAALRERTSGRFAGYGSRLSFAVVGAEVADSNAALGDAAHRIARDAAIWDQRGCLSPRLCFVEGDLSSARAVARTLAGAFDALAETLPPGAMTSEECLEVRRFRDAAEWSGSDDFFFAPSLGAGSVAVARDFELQPGPSHRCLTVVPARSTDELLSLLAPLRPFLECAGLAVSPARRDQLRTRLEAFGIPLVVAAGEMQRPPLDWRHGGRARTAPWTGEE